MRCGELFVVFWSVGLGVGGAQLGGEGATAQGASGMFRWSAGSGEGGSKEYPRGSRIVGHDKSAFCCPVTRQPECLSQRLPEVVQLAWPVLERFAILQTLQWAGEIPGLFSPPGLSFLPFLVDSGNNTRPEFCTIPSPSTIHPHFPYSSFFRSYIHPSIHHSLAINLLFTLTTKHQS